MTAMGTGTRKIGGELPQSPASPGLHPDNGVVAEDLQEPLGIRGQNWVRQHRMALTVADLCCIAAATGLAAAAFPQPDTGYLGAAVAGLWLLGLAAYRSRDFRVLGMGTEEYRRVVTASLITFGVLSILCQLLATGVEQGFFVLAYSSGLAALLCGRLALRRWLARQRTQGRCLSRVVVLGEQDNVEYVIGQIRKKSAGAYLVVGAALVSEQARSTLSVDGQQVPVVSDVRSLIPVLKSIAPDAVIVAGPVPGGSEFVRDLGWRLEESSTELVLATGLDNIGAPRIYVRPVEGLPLMHINVPSYWGLKHVAKRLMDIVLSGCALLVLLPVFAALAWLVTYDSRGPAIFRQERVGHRGRTFIMYKFRSMVQTAESDLSGLVDRSEGAGLLFKLHEDPRVTRVGKWLRRHSLDELPQLWNVFKGDMSLVGPRPPLQSEVAAYEKAVHRRLYVRPGLTGMWQINGRSDLSWKDSVRLDLYYVENWSLAGDLMIMLRTVKELVRPHGAY
ncbi:sugar transferase [Arthrobacter globiformis]|uniref:sugar transferase n=1 Tax=Arthrobacter globiformis TaxID=1665 RepID=UPI00155487D1|nr:sugar transferase [Arthrobacter globiformis]